MFRLVAVTVVCLSLGLFLARVVLMGLWSGAVAYSSARVCRRAHNPVGYWSLIGLFSLIAIGSVCVWAKVVQR